PRRLLVDDRVLEPTAPGRSSGLPLHRVAPRAPGRGRPRAPALERRAPRRPRLRRLVPVRAPAARAGRARRLGPDALLRQRPARAARGRGRPALGARALPPADLAAPRRALARLGGRGRGGVARPARAPELRLAADERDPEGARAEGRPSARGRADPARGRAARERRGADGGGAAHGPGREAERARVGKRRGDLRPGEARV